MSAPLLADAWDELEETVNRIGRTESERQELIRAVRTWAEAHYAAGERGRISREPSLRVWRDQIRQNGHGRRK